MRHMVSVRQRPHLHTFLERVSQLFEASLAAGCLAYVCGGPCLHAAVLPPRAGCAAPSSTTLALAHHPPSQPQVVVFTASQRVYAEQLLNIVDPQRRLVRHRVYRESCVFWEGNYLKDLTGGWGLGFLLSASLAPGRHTPGGHIGAGPDGS